MADDVHTSTEPSLATLVTGITEDLQQLIRQQATLIRQEVQEDIRKSKEGVMAFALGGFAAAIAVVLLAFTIVYALATTGLPLWACFLIVTGIFVVLAAALILAGKQKFDSIRPLNNPAVQGLRENLEWRTNANAR
jgi:hypothetical protein